MQIHQEEFYHPTSHEMGLIAKPQTLAKWRHEGRGPAYHKSGQRVIYHGRDVLEWLDSRRIETERGSVEGVK